MLQTFQDYFGFEHTAPVIAIRCNDGAYVC